MVKRRGEQEVAGRKGQRGGKLITAIQIVEGGASHVPIAKRF